MSSLKNAIRITLLVAAGLLAAPIAASANEPAAVAAPEKKLQSLDGRLPANCPSCGTVVAINRVEADDVPPALQSPAAKALKKPVFEIVVRLSAGTQQIVTVDRMPQLTIGQRVRITDGAVVPEAG
jgi:ABC-type sugar transport system substrate-binding protein